jgi:hypothetical protein
MAWKRFMEKLANWELWPHNARYVLIAPVWLWYCLRARSPWFFSSSNPTLTFGGFEGEDKKEMYNLLPAAFHPVTTYLSPAEPFEEVSRKIRETGLRYPFVVKPDVGMKGLLFRKIDNEAQLRMYHQKNPVDYLAQELIDYPLEVSVFYYRHPAQAKGVISGFIQKELMDVTGDGVNSLWDLIRQHPIARHRGEEMRTKHEEYLDTVIPKGERYILTYAANLNRGARFTNLRHLIDEDLLKLFDEISHLASFYYGRYDIKCASIEDLKRGKNFTILEFNGSGAEPNHVYHSGYSLLGANKVFLHHWKMLYRIAAYNHKAGIRYWPLLKGWRFIKGAYKNMAVLQKADSEVLV